MSLIFQVKFQKERFLAKYDHFFCYLFIHFEPLLGWECAYVYYDVGTEKEGIYVKYWEYKANTWQPSSWKLSFKKNFF